MTARDRRALNRLRREWPDLEWRVNGRTFQYRQPGGEWVMFGWRRGMEP